MMQLKVGDQAPNFDLASTEGAVLMLCDEVPRSPVLLVFFAKESPQTTLGALHDGAAALARVRVKILGISDAPVEELRAIQGEMALRFPLLSDDRGFARLYGVGTDDGEERQPPTLVLVDRDQRILLLERSVHDLPAALARVTDAVMRLPSSTVNYPRSVINRLIDRWVN